MNSSSRLGALFALGAAAGFATLAVFGRLAVDDGLRSPTLLQWRFALGALALAVSGGLRPQLPAPTRLALLAYGFLYTAQTSFYFAALTRITAGTTALLLYLAPGFVVVYSVAIGRRPSRHQLTALLIALGGLGVIVGVPTTADRSLAGTAFGAAAGATFGLYLLLGEAVFGHVPARPMAFHSMAGAALGFVAVDLFTNGRLDLPSGSRQWVLVACVVVFPTVVAIPLLFNALSHLGAGPTAIITTTEPVFTVVFGAFFLAEPVRLVQLLGGVLILGAAVLAQRGLPSMPHTLRVREP